MIKKHIVWLHDDKKHTCGFYDLFETDHDTEDYVNRTQFDIDRDKLPFRITYKTITIIPESFNKIYSPDGHLYNWYFKENGKKADDIWVTCKFGDKIEGYQNML